MTGPPARRTAARGSRRPALSVLLPCRDAEPWLPECLASLEEQTETDFEVVAVDDGSRDGTRRLLEAWAARDPRVRVLDGGGGGLVPALRLAAGAARGRLLARMDADDIALPDRLAAQRRFLEERGDLAACGTGVRYFPREAAGSGYRRYEGWLNSLHAPEAIGRDLFVECPVAHPTLMIRADAYRRVGGYLPVGWPEDYDLIMRLHLAGMGVANVPRVLLRWRISPGRLSTRSPAYSPDAFRRCKVHYLRRGVLPEDRPLTVWGAGKVGKGLARELLRQEVGVDAFVDLDPRKIGQEIHGAPVRRPEDLAGASPRPYVLVAVGSPGAREEIRQALARLGFLELRDFRAAA